MVPSHAGRYPHHASTRKAPTVMQYCRAALRLVLLAALALPALIGDRAAASSPAPAVPLPPAVFFPPLHPQPPSERDTLDAAAHLLGVTPGRVAHEDALNVLGGARLLARAARALSPHGHLPRTLGGWAPAVVWLAGMRSRLATEALLREVYGLLAQGGALLRRQATGDRRQRAALGWPARRTLNAARRTPNVRALAPLLPLPAAAR